MVAKSDPVIHQAISKTSRQIRLLRILSDTSAKGLECSLEVYNIDTAPLYTALSYTWGPVAPLRQITINQTAVRVRENCHAGLIHACLHRRILSEYLWIDAICIDQENSLEKNHQVGLMAEIFAKADSVLVSLGPDYRNINFELIERTLMEQRWTEHEVVLADLLRIRRAPYWTRLWIVQEYLVAPNGSLYIAFGDNIIEDTKLHELFEIIHRYQSKPKIKLNRELLALKTCWTDILQSNMASLSSDRHKKIPAHDVEPEKRDLGHVLETYGSYSCSDTRDKVFGLLSLVRWTNSDTKVHADYTKSAFEVGVDCLRCGVPPWLLRVALHLHWENAQIQNWIRSLSAVTSQPRGLAASNSLPEALLDSASLHPCDHFCTMNSEAIIGSHLHETTRDYRPYENHFPPWIRVTWVPNRELKIVLKRHAKYELKPSL